MARKTTNAGSKAARTGNSTLPSRRDAVREIEKGHHMAPRQRVTSNRKTGTVKTAKRNRSR